MVVLEVFVHQSDTSGSRWLIYLGYLERVSKGTIYKIVVMV